MHIHFMKNIKRIIGCCLITVIMIFLYLLLSPNMVSAESGNLEVTQNAITISEADLPLSSPTKKAYKLIPSQNGVVNSTEGLILYHEVSGELISIAKSSLEDCNYYVRKNNVYYIEAQPDTNVSFTKKDEERVLITFDSNGGAYKNTKKHELYLKPNTRLEILDYGLYGLDIPKREGYSMDLWDCNTKPDGTGFSVTEFDYFTKDITFYAQWKKRISVTFDANGSCFIGDWVDPDTGDYTKKNNFTIVGYENSLGSGVERRWVCDTNNYYVNNDGPYYYKLPPINDNTTLKEWNTKPDGSGKSFKIDEAGVFTVFDDVTLYAIWEKSDEGIHHYKEISVATNATCTDVGKESDKICSICGNFVEGKEIPAIGHSFGEWTKLNDTQHQRVCANDSNHVEKANHTWDAGTVTKKATANEEGVKVYKCTACGASYTETIPKLKPKKKSDPAQQKGSDGTALGSGASAAAAEKAITNMKNDNDPAGAVFLRIMLNSKKQSAKTIALQWKKVKGAKKYTIYGNACGKANKMKKIATVKTNKFTVKKVAKGKLKKGTYYKFIVVAVNAKDKVVSSSKVIHVATKGNKKKSNNTKIVVKPKKGIKLKVKKTAKLKVTVMKAKKTTVRKHVGIRYESTNKKVATVSKKGVIKGKAKGKCKVYACAQNGLYKAVNVTVK